MSNERKPRVLMLGWEFPPILTGGLGQACYGLSKAMSQYADLTMIIPKSDRNFQVENVNIIGLNQLKQKDVEEQPINMTYREFAEVTYVETETLFRERGMTDTRFTPYPEYAPYDVHWMEYEPYTQQRMFTEQFGYDVPYQVIPEARINMDAVHRLFDDKESYGARIIEKVAAYAEVVAKIAVEKEFDIIHAHDWITFPAAIKIKEMTGKPLAVHVHSLETDRIGVGAVRNPHNRVYHIELEGMTAADIVFPVSEFTKTCITKHYGIDEEKIFPVYNAIDPADTFRIEKNMDKKIVLFLGRITHQKGPEFLLDTAEKLLYKEKNVLFVIAGTGDKQRWLMDQVNQKQLAEYFIFTGFLNKAKVINILAQSDVYFMPSVSEPFGLSALEAAQFEIPCVLSAQSGVSEVLTETLTANFWDTSKFANYIYALLHYKGLRSELVNSSKQDIEEMSWNKTAQKLMKLYKKIL